MIALEQITPFDVVSCYADSSTEQFWLLMVSKVSKTLVWGRWFERVSETSFKLTGAANIKIKINNIIRLDTSWENFYVLKKHCLSNIYYEIGPAVVSLLESEVESLFN